MPDARVAKLAEVFKPKKITYATIEYVDIGGIQKDREKNAASLVPLREADALAHVVRLFEDPSVPHEGGSLDALRDIVNVDLELILTDLEQAAKRIERVEKDLKKKKDPLLEVELQVLTRCRLALEAETPLRELEFKPEEMKMITGFMSPGSVPYTDLCCFRQMTARNRAPPSPTAGESNTARCFPLIRSTQVMSKSVAIGTGPLRPLGPEGSGAPAAA